MAVRQALSIESLEHQHRGLSAQLDALLRHAHLTPLEELTVRELKKRKLDAKDRIAALRRLIRHPQLTGVLAWGLGHLFSNGEARSLILFGGLALWAGLQMILLNRRDGAWQKPERVPVGSDLKLLLTGAGFFAIFMYTHEWLFGVGPVPYLSQ